jgi:hypothetical protein
MNKTVWIIALLALVAGCGHDPNTSVYDTIGNPEGFPPQALRVIDAIDKGQLASYQAITDAFGELYSTRPDLLDNSQWEKIVTLLGVKFRLRADTLAARGTAYFEDAAKMYTLAAFARPQDEKIQARKQLFEVWDRAVNDSVINASTGVTPGLSGLDGQLAMLKYFLYGDSLQQAFAKDYLWPQALSLDSVDAALKPSAVRPLSPIDRCFLSVVGFRHFMPETRLTSFAEPQIDLVAARVARRTGNWYDAELYFVPREDLARDYIVAFRVTQSDSTGALSQERLSLDFHPGLRTNRWKAKSLNVAYRRFVLTGPLRDIEIGVYELKADSTHFIPMRDSGRPLFTLPASAYSPR